MQTFKDKVVLITGSGRGLGRAAALRFAELGADVVVNDLDERNAETTARMIVKHNVRSMISNHDVAERADVEKMFEQALNTMGKVDILVNNAGILRDAMLDKMTEADFDAVLRVNLKGVFLCSQVAARLMRAKGRGVIVNVSSISYLGNIGQTNYAAAKAGVIGMTKTWAMELARHGIRVNAIAPGMMETDMTKNLPEKVKAAVFERIPLKRMGRPEEFANAIAFLASEDASYLTGAVLNLDGGSSVGGF